MKKHTGGCHCGKVRFEVTMETGTAIACNCSICSKKAGLLAFAPADQFKLLSGAEALRDYQVGKKRIHHLFCGGCGVASFGRGTDPKGNEVCAVNVRCLDGIDLTAVNVQHYDGKSL